ncbi:UDP-glucuronosyltransferase 3A1-like isoform X1 [Rana temporaria]|uniref:UDP-glucuronosyltransferase 3A1-like isoform X1 n=1 Tax=Rana temporaria TaxID=8407 RepID=UPI001AACF9E5|nr:UDP-glucuronosyltransferase 3A1-like isoform X1 [Rana temporaria]
MAACKKQAGILLIFALQFLFIDGAKILTICLIGGSHYLLMDQISQILHNNGHEVRMFLQSTEGTLPGYKRQPSPYPVTTYSLDEKYLQEFMDHFVENQKKFLTGSQGIQSILTFLKDLSYQCNITLHQTEILNFLKEEHYDIAVVEAFNPCTFLVSEKLGLPFIAFFPGMMANADRVGMPTPLSYIPLFQTQLSDQMDFFGRLKNTMMFLGSLVIQKKMDSLYDDVIEEHFPAESRPTIADLILKAELWLYNIDFTLEYPRPLLPHVQYIGGLLAKPVKPISQELEDFISESGDAGFIVVTLGSMLSSVPLVEFMKEMNGGFAKIQQKVIWRYQRSKWPQDVEIPPNVKIMDWLSQNDLLGHPKVRLLVTHGGMNSLMEAVYHGVPVLGIPLFGDQHENMARVKYREMGTYIPPEQLKAENFASTIQHIIENKSYKTSAMKLQAIRRSQPFPPDQQLLRWVEHIIQSGGGSHLHPYSYKLPWYQYWLLDVILFLFIILTVATYLIVTLFRSLIRKCCSPKKLKRN